jgi:large subunit ribosomal protein L9
MTDFGKRIARLRLEFKARVGETGRLYGSITSSDIAESIQAELGEEMDRRKIMLDESIRTLGEHEVPIHLMPGVNTSVTVSVVPEEGYELPVGEPEAAAVPEESTEEEAAPA